jgi:oxygen-dependent protoporphyrinogen oxidase
MGKVAIIGAGITGLGAAWRLKRAGHAVTVFEGGARVGGSICTHQEAGYLVEEGPNTIQLTSQENERWLDEVGLGPIMQDSDPRAGKRFLVRDGRVIAVPGSPMGFLRTPLFSWKAKLRLAGEFFAPKADPDLDEPLSDFVVRRLGREMLDYAIDPFVGGVYAGNPHQLSVRYGFPKLHRLEQNHRSLILGTIALRRARKRAGSLYQTRLVSFPDGLQALPEKLARDLGDSVRLEHPVSAIERNERWTVRTDKAASTGSEEFDAVVLALPAPALAGILINGEQAFTSLSEIESPPVTSYSLGFSRNQVGHPLDGFGALVPSCERLNILGTLFSSSLFEGRAPDGHVLLTTFVGGTRAPDLAHLSDADLHTVVLADLKQLIQVEGEPSFVHRRTWPRAIPQYKVGHGRFIETIRENEAQHPGLLVGGNARDGISLSYCIEGGRRLAEETRAYLDAAAAS